jgi:hypothetical protein
MDVMQQTVGPRTSNLFNFAFPHVGGLDACHPWSGCQALREHMLGLFRTDYKA